MPSKTHITPTINVIVIITRLSQWTQDIAWSPTWCEAMFSALDERAVSISRLRDQLDELSHDAKAAKDRSEETYTQPAKGYGDETIRADVEARSSTFVLSNKGPVDPNIAPKVSGAADDYTLVQLIEYCIQTSASLMYTQSSLPNLQNCLPSCLSSLKSSTYSKEPERIASGPKMSLIF